MQLTIPKDLELRIIELADAPLKRNLASQWYLTTNTLLSLVITQHLILNWYNQTAKTDDTTELTYDILVWTNSEIPNYLNTL